MTSRARTWGAVIVGFSALALYLVTCCPTVSPVGDAGELTAAAVTLGIPHAPGYPLYVMLGHIFSALPLGDMAWRINVMSACFGALAAVVMYLACIEMGADLVMSGVSALLLSTSLSVWEVGVSGEFRTLQLFLSVSLVALTFRWWRAPQPWVLRLMALTMGLGLSTHYTFALLVGVTGLAVLAFGRPLQRAAWPPFWHLCGLFGVGLLPYLYLPWRARQHPAINWGDPSTPGRLWWVLSRQGYGGITQLKGLSSPGLGGTSLALHNLALACWTHFTPVCLILALVGAALAFRRRPLHAWYIGFSMLVAGPIFIVWEHPLNDPEFWGGLERQLLLFWVGFAVFVAIGLQAAADGLRRYHLRALPAVVLMLPLAFNFPLVDMHREHIAWHYAHDLLEPLAPNAVLLISSDPAYSTTTYAQTVEHVRPDVLVIPTLLLNATWLQQSLAERPDVQGFDFATLADTHDPDPLVDWLLKKRPVYIDNPWPSIEDRLMEQGVVYQVAPTQDAILHFDPLTYVHSLDRQVAQWRATTMRPTDDRHDAAASYIRYIVDEYALGYTNLAVAMGRRGWDGDTRSALSVALDLDPHSAVAHMNLGFVYARDKDYDQALVQYQDAVRDDPHYVAAYQALAEVYARTGHIEDATRIKAEGDQLQQASASPTP